MDDCLIVGAGAIGLALAYELSDQGLSVHVVDRQEPGREASWAGAGILPAARRGTGGTAMARLAQLSRRLHAEWSQRLLAETGIDTGFTECGEIHVARGDEAAAALAREADAWRADDLAVEPLAAEALLAREPALVGGAAEAAEGKGTAAVPAVPPIKSAVCLPEAAQVRNPRYLKALVAGCLHRGVRFSTAAVETLVERGQNVEALATSSGPLRAGNIILAAGAWTEKLLADLGHPLPLKPIRGQIVLLRLPKRIFRSVFHEGPHYLVPRDDGRVLVGSTLEDVGFDKRTTPEAIDELRAFAGSLVPALAAAEIEQCWAGLRPGSLLPHPVIGRLPERANVLVAAGHFRWGLYLSPGTAVLLRQMLGGEEPAIELSAFRPVAMS